MVGWSLSHGLRGYVERVTALQRLGRSSLVDLASVTNHSLGFLSLSLWNASCVFRCSAPSSGFPFDSGCPKGTCFLLRMASLNIGPTMFSLFKEIKEKAFLIVIVY